VLAAIDLSVHAATTTAEAMRERLLPPLRATAGAIDRDLAMARG